jgi:hypothetical protein
MYQQEDVQDWLEVNTFKKWGAQYLQSQSSSSRKRPRSPSPAVEIKRELVIIDLADSDSDLPDFATIDKSVPRRKAVKKTTNALIDIDDSSSSQKRVLNDDPRISVAGVSYSHPASPPSMAVGG